MKLSDAVEHSMAKMFKVIQVDTGFIDFKALFNIDEECSEIACNVSNKRIKPIEEAFSDPSGYGLTADEYRAINGGLPTDNEASVDYNKDAGGISGEGNSSSGVPIHLEIGSGDGEWIAAQAAACIHRGNYIYALCV